VAATSELNKLRRERDLYLRLLDLGSVERPEVLLRDALALIVAATSAKQGYLELHDEHGEVEWWFAHEFTGEQVDEVRRTISRGIVAEAIASGQVIVTPSAMQDPRFTGRESVRMGRIEAVLCAPIGTPPRGVVYLQDQTRPDLFSEDDCASAEAFGRHLAHVVDRLLAQQRAHDLNDPTAPFRAKLRAESLVGRSRALAAVLEAAAQVAPLDVNVLLTGESGTGKSQIARVIHDSGTRADAPFVDLNCAAIPETLVESELFGALPGAHSTASRRQSGKVAAAEHGTLFLDEVSELAPAAQAKLLQLLQSREYFPLGGTKAVRADIRLIAATNADLDRAVAEKRFREDLFYRLQVLPIRVPSLAERRDDVIPLATHFCAADCELHGFAPVELSPAARGALEAAQWPGNVRQLANVVEAAVIRAAGEHADQIEPHHLFPDRPPGTTAEGQQVSFQQATREFQAAFVREALERYEWNVQETARRLDMSRSHLYNLVQAFGLGRPKP
jgi:Nif-specific regulatory protein